MGYMIRNPHICGPQRCFYW